MLSKAYYHFASLLRSKALTKTMDVTVSKAYPATAKETYDKLRVDFNYQLQYNLKTRPALADACEHLASSIEQHGGFQIARRDRIKRYADIAEFHVQYPLYDVPALTSLWRLAYGPAVYVPFDSARSGCQNMLHETRKYTKALMTLRDGIDAPVFRDMMTFANRTPDYFARGYPADVLVWDAISIEHGESARIFLHKDYCSSVWLRDSDPVTPPDLKTHVCFRHVQRLPSRQEKAA